MAKVVQQIFDTCILNKCGMHRQEVGVGPAFGVDVSVVALPSGNALALTSDPLSLIPSLGLSESAWLSVHLMANDMATTGFAPEYGQFVLNLPTTLSKSDLKTYWDYVDRYCSQIGVAITGGHTGFVEGQESTIVGGGTFVTVAPRDQILLSSSAEVGDCILVTKSCALSSVAILAMSFPEKVKNLAGEEVFQKACQSFYDTSSLEDALTAVAGSAHIRAMHDVTEGGVLGAIYELTVASNKGAVIDKEKLPVGDVQAAVCHLFDLDPRRCVGAGSMIITCDEYHVDSVLGAFVNAGIPCVQVGRIKDKNRGVLLLEDGEHQELSSIDEDPYWTAYYKALNKGWK